MYIFYVDLDTPSLHQVNVTKEGDAVVFQCIAKGTGILSYEWVKDGQKLFYFSPIFVINNVNRREQGYYKCIVANNAGVKETPAILLDVLCKYLLFS